MSRVEGADEFIRDLKKLGDNMKKVERAMLKAGGEQMAESWRENIERYGFVDTGAMRDNVTSRVTSKSGSLRAIITSEGYDATGLRNAFKAYILHYGTSRIHASHWIDAAEEQAAPDVHSAMAAVLNQALGKTLDLSSLPESDEYTPFVYDASYWATQAKRHQNKRSKY